MNSIKIEASEYSSVSIRFGPHYFIEIYNESNGTTSFKIGCTHHGFKADASKLGGELEFFINEIRNKYPKNIID